MNSSVSLKPMVTNFVPSKKSADAQNIRIALSELSSSSKNHKLNPLSVMSKRMDLESELYQTKSSPVIFVEDLVSVKPKIVGDVDKTNRVTVPSLENTVRRFQAGKELSRVEQDTVLTNQMDQMSVNNKILHGLM